jgi:hypothetical protein
MSKIYRYAIVGSRNFPEDKSHLVYDYLIKVVFNPYRERPRKIEIVSGDCPIGPDLWAKEFAEKYKIPYKGFPPDKNRTDNKRFIDRNKQIVEYADRIICFYGGSGYRNSGSLSTVEFAAQLNKPWRIIGPHDKI